MIGNRLCQIDFQHLIYVSLNRSGWLFFIEDIILPSVYLHEKMKPQERQRFQFAFLPSRFQEIKFNVSFSPQVCSSAMQQIFSNDCLFSSMWYQYKYLKVLRRFIRQMAKRLRKSCLSHRLQLLYNQCPSRIFCYTIFRTLPLHLAIPSPLAVIRPSIYSSCILNRIPFNPQHGQGQNP